MNKITLIAFGALASVSFTTFAHAGTPMDPAETTCQELVGTEVEFLPQIIYWIDGFNSHGDARATVDTEWFGIPVDKIVDTCKQTPDAKAADVIKKHHIEFHGE